MNMARIRGKPFDSDVQVFDAQGKLMEKGAKNALRSGAFGVKGIYFIKYRNGRIERRMNRAQSGGS
jgi:hypothetical protein